MKTRLTLQVVPGSSRTLLVGRQGGAWKVRVAAVAENGKANAAVVRLLARALDLAQADVEIVSGHGTRRKTVAVSGIEADEVARRLARASGRSSNDADQS